MWIVRLALRRPYTFVVMALLIAIQGGVSIATMPVDIFPYIDIPVVSVVWQYNGLSPEEMESRIITNFERGAHLERRRHRTYRIAVPSERGGRPGLLSSRTWKSISRCRRS